MGVPQTISFPSPPDGGAVVDYDKAAGSGERVGVRRGWCSPLFVTPSGRQVHAFASGHSPCAQAAVNCEKGVIYGPISTAWTRSVLWGEGHAVSRCPKPWHTMQDYHWRLTCHLPNPKSKFDNALVHRRVLNWGYPQTVSFPCLPRTVGAEPSTITTRLRRCPAGEGRGEGDWCSPRFVTPSGPPAHAVLHMPPHPALSHRNLRGSAERCTERTRSVPGERDRELSDVLKQPDGRLPRRRTAGGPQN